MKQILLTCLILLLSSPTIARSYSGGLTAVGPGKNYASIEFMTLAESVSLVPVPEESVPAGGARANSLRLVVHRSESSQEVVFETVTEGLEGCCIRVTGARKLNLQAFASAFGFSGELSGFVFDRWSSPLSFRFRYKDKLFVANLVGKSSIRISRVKTGA